MPGGAADGARRDNRVVIVVTTIAVLILVVAVALVLAHAAPRSLGSNQVPLSGDALVLEGHERACQAQVPVPAGTGRIDLHARALEDTTPGLVLRLIDHGRLIRKATIPAGWSDGALAFRFATIGKVVSQPSVCLRVAGRQRVAVEGYSTSIRVDYLSARPQSWWSRIGLLNDRFPQGKSAWYGSWSLAIAFALVVLAAIVALIVVTRREP